jgi:hypothetical protein
MGIMIVAREFGREWNQEVWAGYDVDLKEALPDREQLLLFYDDDDERGDVDTSLAVCQSTNERPLFSSFLNDLHLLSSQIPNLLRSVDGPNVQLLH